MKEWNVEDVRKILNEVGNKMNCSCEKVPIIISKRLKNSLGRFEFSMLDRAYLSPIAFKFSSSFLSGKYSVEEVIDVIKHEYCHFYTCEKYQYDCGHNKLFKEACKEVGANAKSIYDGVIEHDEEVFKWNLMCKNCGIIGKYKIKKNLSAYCCVKCSGKVYLEAINQ